MKLPSGPLAEKVGFVLTRVVVPLWIVTGAAMKLWEKSPKLLPKNIWTTADDWGVNLYWLLFVLIGLEFFAVAVIWLLPRFARFMAIWMLSLFCLILVGEILAGNTKCGCLGAASPSPWVMLAIDGALLLGVLLLRPRAAEGPWLPRTRLAATAIVTLVAFALTGVRVLGENRPAAAVVEAGSGGEGAVVGAGPAGDGADAAGAGAGAAPALPAYFRIKDDQALVGERLLGTDLGRFVRGWPEDLEVGPRYVVFFSRSCDHCRDLLETHLQAPPPVPTTLVAIPETKEGFTEDSWLDMQYCRECVGETLELPVGVDYLITPPVVIALAEGEVTCAKESDDALAPECFTWH
jgi:hypothetical protein